MITNLFSIFDPSTSMRNSFNWVSIFLCFFITPFIMWTTPNRVTVFFFSIINFVIKEFKPLIKKTPQTLLIILRLFSVIMLNNLFGLLPYIFTATRHISLTLRLSLALWLGIIIHRWTFNTSNILIHLIPNNTPAALIPFIVIIETIRNIIRPLTLAIRLAANIIAGHLLITLLTRANPITPLYGKWVLFRCQLILGRLELAVAFIQAYVFRVLITLYLAERVS